MTPARIMEPTPASIAVMSCHRVKRDALGVHRRLEELLQQMQASPHPEAMREYRAAFEAMYRQVVSLRRSLESARDGVTCSPTQQKENRELGQALNIILNDTGTLAALLLRLMDVEAPAGAAPDGQG